MGESPISPPGKKNIIYSCTDEVFKYVEYAKTCQCIHLLHVSSCTDWTLLGLRFEIWLTNFGCNGFKNTKTHCWSIPSKKTGLQTRSSEKQPLVSFYGVVHSNHSIHTYGLQQHLIIFIVSNSLCRAESEYSQYLKAFGHHH